MKRTNARIVAAAVCLASLLSSAAMKAPPPAPSAEAGTLPPKDYMPDYYAPPPDAVPERDIGTYTLNTRVPDYFWLKYEGAHTLALRIRPITKEAIEKEIAVGLVDTNVARNAYANKDALVFVTDLEKSGGCRTVVIRDLNVDADDFVSFSFKMKSSVRNAGAGLKVFADGTGTMIDTAKDVDTETKCADGFTAYKVTLKPQKGRRLTDVRFVPDASSSSDYVQEFVIFDLNFKRSAPRARFTDLPQRQWMTKAAFFADRPQTVADAIPDVCAYVRAPSNRAESIALPLAGWYLRPQTDKEKDGGFTVEPVKVPAKEIPGAAADLAAVRITLTTGPRCYLKFPVEFDATDYNTMTLYAKIELPDGLPPFSRFGEKYSGIEGNDCTTLNGFFDVFSFGVNSRTRDAADWNQYGVAQGHSRHNRQAVLPGGWEAIAQDLRHGDLPNNKSTALDAVTDWCFYYANAKIPAGKKVAVTIADPRVTKGLIRAGGDPAKYKAFLADAKNRLMTPDVDWKKRLEAPVEGRLAAPLPFIRGHMPQGEFILARSGSQGYQGAFRTIPMRAIDAFQDLLANKYGLVDRFPVLDRPTTNDNVKIFVGGEAYARVDKARYEADRKALKGSSGFAVRAEGKCVYVYAGDFNYAGDARGLADGVYALMEYNTDEIMAMTTRRNGYVHRDVFAFAKDGDMDLVWGDGYVEEPAFPYSVIFGSDPDYLDRNRCWQEDSWDLSKTHGGIMGLGTGHWLAHYGSNTAYGPRETRGKENETWGVDEQGKRVKPDCYTRHACMINVLEPAKADYVTLSQGPVENCCFLPPDKAYAYNAYQEMGFWLEDNHHYCLCEKCRVPIRLPDGSLIREDNPLFRGTQFYANGSAMINAVNVYTKRTMRIEPIGYFWMSSPPATEVSRNYSVRFCPYLRKNYFEPIYAPCNDLFWRNMHRWGQVPGVKLFLYDYFLTVAYRPWAGIAKYDIPAERGISVELVSHEGSSDVIDMMERWTTLRLFRQPAADPAALRHYWIARTFREAAPEMEKFYSAMNNYVWTDFAPKQLMEFDDLAWVGTRAFLTKSAAAGLLNPGLNVMDELDGYVEAAWKKVENPVSRDVLAAFRKRWKAYYNEAKGYAEQLKAQNRRTIPR